MCSAGSTAHVVFAVAQVCLLWLMWLELPGLGINHPQRKLSSSTGQREPGRGASGTILQLCLCHGPWVACPGVLSLLVPCQSQRAG